uniref:ExPiwi1 n=1 Tax=Nematostella vectensis TaxID=45351 RepID=A0A286RTJ1_NEMVE|nr:ExPiwi1 [Nematostella vectensis]
MTGRARGRARGRENNTQNTRRPGEPVPVSYGNQEVDRAVGYGRNAIGSSHNPQGLTDEFPSLSLGNTRNQAENSGINTHVSGNDIVSGNNTGTWQGLPANGVTAAQRNEVGRGRAGNTNGGVQGNQVGLAVGGRAGNTNGGVQGSEVGLAVRGRAGNTNGGVQGSEVGLAVGGRAGNTNGGVQGSEVGLAVGGRAGNTNGGVQGSELGLAVGVRAGNTNGGVQGSEVGLAVGGRAGNTNGGVQGSEVGLAVGGRAGNTNGGVQGSEVGLAVGGRAGNTNGGVQGSGVGLSVGVRAAESRTSSSGNGYSGGSGGPGMQSGHPGNARSRPIEQRSFPGRTNDEERSAAGQGAVQQLVTQSAQASLPPGFGLRKGFNTVGGVGQQIQLATNHFALTMRGDQDCLYQYSLEFSPDLEHKAKRMQAIRSIENTIGEVWLYDKGQMMFLPVQLPDEITCCQGSIRRRDTPEGVPVQVTITYRCDVLANSPSFGQVLNTIMARIQQTLGMKRIGDRYFYTEDPFVIPQHRIEILPGFRTSIQHHDNGYLLGLDVAHKYLRSETVVEFLHNLSQRMPNHDSYTDEATRQLCGEIVLTRAFC